MVFQGVVTVLMILMVLLQFGKGAEAGLMTGASDSVFTASQQGNILSKATVVLATLFLANSLFLAHLQGKRSSTSIMDAEAPITRPLNTTQEKVGETPASAQQPAAAAATASASDTPAPTTPKP